MSDLTTYVRSWVSRQPPSWAQSRDASSVAREFLADPGFWPVHISLCGILGSADETVVQTAVITAIGSPYGLEVALLVDALKLTCERGKNIKASVLALGAILVLLAVFG